MAIVCTRCFVNLPTVYSYSTHVVFLNCPDQTTVYGYRTHVVLLNCPDQTTVYGYRTHVVLLNLSLIHI